MHKNSYSYQNNHQIIHSNNLLCNIFIQFILKLLNWGNRKVNYCIFIFNMVKKTPFCITPLLNINTFFVWKVLWIANISDLIKLYMNANIIKTNIFIKLGLTLKFNEGHIRSLLCWKFHFFLAIFFDKIWYYQIFIWM